MLPSTRRTLHIGLSICALGVAAAPVLAAPVKPDRAQVLKTLADCRKTADATERVACYDKAVDAFDAAEAKGDVIVVSRDHLQAAQKQAFGFNLPSLDNLFGGAVKGQAVDKITLDIIRVHKNAEHKWVMITADGAVWHLTEDEDLAEDPHSGSKVLVTRGALGAFFCKVDGQPSARCARIS